MVHQNLVDFPGTDFLAATIDDFFETPSDADVALVIHDTLVPGTEPAVLKGFVICLGVVLISCSDIGAADHDLAESAAWQERAVVVHDRDFRSGGDAHFAWLAHGWGHRVARHLVGRLRHAVGFDQRRAENLLQFGDHLGRHGRRRGAHKAQGIAGDDFLVTFGTAHDRLVHGRYRGVPGGIRLIHPAEKFQSIEAWCAKHL